MKACRIARDTAALAIVGWVLHSAPTLAQTARGRVERGTLASAALAGNIFNDPTNRSYAVYLPPGYDRDNQHFPVFYVLHGFTQQYDSYIGAFQSALDSGIRLRRIGEMIAVFVDGRNKLEGCWYRSNPVIGDYEKYITVELVELIDRKYRTLASRESRGVTGYSMGGEGSLHLALKYPAVFSVVVSQAGALCDVTELYALQAARELATAQPKTFAALSGATFGARAFQAWLTACVPNLDRPPFLSDSLYDLVDRNPVPNDATHQRVQEHDIAHGDLPRYVQQPLRLNGIKIVQGVSDTLVPVSSARNFRQRLTALGIDHAYEEHMGGHDFLPDRSLSFLSEKLVGAELFVAAPKLSVSRTEAGYVLSFGSQIGVEYVVESARMIEPGSSVWETFQRVAGDGQVLSVVMPGLDGPRFFRVRASNARP